VDEEHGCLEQAPLALGPEVGGNVCVVVVLIGELHAVLGALQPARSGPTTPITADLDLFAGRSQMLGVDPRDESGGDAATEERQVEHTTQPKSRLYSGYGVELLQSPVREAVRVASAYQR
jgi:hypothetical protein